MLMIELGNDTYGQQRTWIVTDRTGRVICHVRCNTFTQMKSPEVCDLLADGSYVATAEHDPSWDWAGPLKPMFFDVWNHGQNAQFYL